MEQALEADNIPVVRKLLTEALQYAVEMQRETPEQRRRDSRVVVHF